MLDKRDTSEDAVRRAPHDAQTNLSPQGIAVSLGLAVAVFALWSLTASPQMNEWYFFERYTSPIFAFNVACTYVALLSVYVLAKQGLRKERVFKVVANLVALSALLVMIEMPAAFGLFDYRTLLAPKMIGGVGPHNRIYETGIYWHRPPHDEFLSDLPGDTSLRLALRDPPTYPAQHRYDQNGFRNDRDLEQAEIVLLGDSFVEGYKVTQRETLSAKLASLLGKDVANLGHAGFGPQNELGVLRAVGLGLQPEVIVWFFFEGNDLYDYEEERRTWAQHAGGLRERLLSTNLLRIANRWSLRWTPSERRELRIAHALLASPLTEYPTRMYFELFPTETMNTASDLESCQEFIEWASELSAQNGSRFILVYVPTKIRVYKDVVEVVQHGQDDLSSGYASSLARWSQGKGIEFHDLTPALSAGARNGKLVYFPDDEHWTPLGHTLVASEMVEFIGTER